jgi:hypothetical protein
MYESDGREAVLLPQDLPKCVIDLVYSGEGLIRGLRLERGSLSCAGILRSVVLQQNTTDRRGLRTIN